MPLCDLACIYGAACDVALVDVGFRTSMSPTLEGAGLLHALHETYIQAQKQAQRDAKKSPQVVCMLSVMDVQIGRVLTCGTPVRGRPLCSLPPPCKSVSYLLSPITAVLPKACWSAYG